MGIINGKLARNLTGFVFGVNPFTPPVLVEIGLLDEGGLELDADCLPSYARVPFTDWVCSSGACTSEDEEEDQYGAGVMNASDIAFPTIATGEEWNVGFIRVYGDGEPLYTVSLQEAAQYNAGDTPTVIAKKLKLYIEYSNAIIR